MVTALTEAQTCVMEVRFYFTTQPLGHVCSTQLPVQYDSCIIDGGSLGDVTEEGMEQD
jgi:hypothetical protein